MSLALCHIPQEWKVHRIRPILKSGDKLLVSYYRPISLLCVTSKVLEKLVYNKIIDFVTPKLSKNQFGFSKGKSCLSQLLLSYGQLYKEIDRGAKFNTIFLDFKKAFDSVPHNVLLIKLWRLGIMGDLWLWFREYLTQRLHYVQIDQTPSSLLPVKSGVPQGSILGTSSLPYLY